METSYYSYQRAENKAKVEQTIKRNTVSHSQSQSQPVTGSSILYQSLVDPVGGLASSQTCNHSVVPSADLLVNASMSKQAIIANSGKLESTPNRALKMTTVLGTTPLYDISAEGTRARMGLYGLIPRILIKHATSQISFAAFYTDSGNIETYK